MNSRSFWLGAVVLFFVLPVTQSFGQVLSQSGPCPGTKTFTATGMTPNSSVAYIRAFGTGNVVIPGGLVCFGTQLGLNGTATLVTVATANGSGVAVVTATVPVTACNLVYMQALDFTTCLTTNVILIQ